jgi:hypothetical protein
MKRSSVCPHGRGPDWSRRATGKRGAPPGQAALAVITLTSAVRRAGIWCCRPRPAAAMPGIAPSASRSASAPGDDLGGQPVVRIRALARTNELDAGGRWPMMVSEESLPGCGLRWTGVHGGRWLPRGSVRESRRSRSHIHPFDLPRGGGHDHVFRGTGLLSQFAGREVVTRLRLLCELARRRAAPPGVSPRRCLGCGGVRGGEGLGAGADAGLTLRADSDRGVTIGWRSCGGGGHQGSPAEREARCRSTGPVPGLVVARGLVLEGRPARARIPIACRLLW